MILIIFSILFIFLAISYSIGLIVCKLMYKTCPYCRKTIDKKASICPHCQKEQE